MMLLGYNKKKQRGVVQPQMIFIGLGIVILLMIGFGYSQSKARDERIQALQQKTQEINAANVAMQAASSSHAATTVNNVNKNQPEMAQSAYVDLSQIRQQVAELTSTWGDFQTAKPSSVLSDSSHLAEKIANLQSIQSDFSRIRVDSCLNQPKSDIEKAMQLTIDGYSTYLQSAKAGENQMITLLIEADKLIQPAYDQMNICQN